MATRRKIYVEGVPFTEVVLSNDSSIRLYDTSGPGSDPVRGRGVPGPVGARPGRGSR